MPGAPLITITDLSKAYQTRGRTTVKALDRVSVTITEGELVTVVGPSGCGKTTLLKILAGLLSRSGG